MAAQSSSFVTGDQVFIQISTGFNKVMNAVQESCSAVPTFAMILMMSLLFGLVLFAMVIPQHEQAPSTARDKSDDAAPTSAANDISD